MKQWLVIKSSVPAVGVNGWSRNFLISHWSPRDLLGVTTFQVHMHVIPPYNSILKDGRICSVAQYERIYDYNGNLTVATDISGFLRVPLICSMMIYGEKKTNLHFSLLEILFCIFLHLSTFTLNLVITHLRRKDFYPRLLLPVIFFNESLSICRAHLFKRKAEFILSNTVLLKIIR